MKDLEIELENSSGELARMGHALGHAGVSIEGGGAWIVNGRAVAHFLFVDGDAARKALLDAGIRVVAVRDVIVQRLDQEAPGQLGKFIGMMADAGVIIEAQYSDHNNQLVLVVDDIETARRVSDAWPQPK